MKKIINDIEMGKTWTSYISALHGVLKSAGLTNKDLWKLMGDTGMGFHFILHEELCPSSVTVYNWVEEHQEMLDRIGIESSITCVMDFADHEDREAVKVKAIDDIKKSIDEGFSVINWAPTPILEFGIIHGYDTDDKVFFTKDVTGQETDPLLFDNIGISDVPILYYQTFGEKNDMDEYSIIKNSLSFGINQWKKEVHNNTENYFSGKRAYKVLIEALENNKFDPSGLSYNMAVYNDSKSCLAKYIKYINENTKFKGKLNKAAENYRKVSEIFNDIYNEIPFPYNGKELSDKTKQMILLKLKQSLELENTSMIEIEKVV